MDQVEWFVQNAHGGDTIKNPTELVSKLHLIASMKGLDFREVTLRASLWAMTHPAKKNWGRFYAGWFGRERTKPTKQTVNWSDPI